MDRRKAFKIAAGAVAAGGAGLFTMTTAFKPEIKFDNTPQKLDFKQDDNNWEIFRFRPSCYCRTCL
jgi:hypothetical protein